MKKEYYDFFVVGSKLFAPPACERVKWSCLLSYDSPTASLWEGYNISAPMVNGMWAEVNRDV